MAKLIKSTGGYKTFTAYRKTEVIYDLTFHFCHTYLERGDRTIDQMVQAARSGKQNIVEAKEAAATSKETMLKLLNVARASLHELLIDYEDYLRTRHFEKWATDSVQVSKMRELGTAHDDSEFFMKIAESRSADVVANMVIVLIHQADNLLTRYIEKQYENFIDEGGFREHLSRVRRDSLSHQELPQNHHL